MPRHYLALIVAAVAVLGMGMYLFHEVRATPAPPEVHPVASRASEPHDSEPPKPVRPAIPPPIARPAAVRPPDGSAEATLDADRPRPTIPTSGLGDRPRADYKLDAVMDEANKAYDRGDFDEARGIAAKVLAQNPNNTRMLRILVSSQCIEGDSAEAQKAYVLLPKPDREGMKIRCARYGVTLTDP